MSYILDALRRSQAERERGHMPGVHTTVRPQPGVPIPQPRRAGAWGALALALVLALVITGWRLWPGAQPQPAKSEIAFQNENAPAGTAAPSAKPLPTEPPATALAAESVAAKEAPAPSQALLPAPVSQPKVRVAREPVRERQPSSRPTPRPAAAQESKPAAQGEGQAPVFAQSDLPPAVQAQLPTLQLAGITYSSNPKFRMVIVNGQVLHEGDLAAPGLQLERIEQGRTIWSFRGYRYALAAQ